MFLCGKMVPPTTQLLCIQVEVDKALTIVVHHTAAVFPHSSVIVGVVSPNIGIHIPDDQEHIMLRDFSDCAL